MPWIIPEDKLDKEQKEYLKFISTDSGNFWIKGLPGTGKSVLLAYALKQIKERKPNASVVVVVFTRSLVQMYTEAFAEMGIYVRVVTIFQFMKSLSHNDYVLCDEVQDLVPSVLTAMKERADHVIVAGDENQSIYESDPRFHEATVSPSQIRTYLSVQPRNVKTLTVIHRLPVSVIKAVDCLMPEMNIVAGTQHQASSSAIIRLCDAYGPSEEVKYVMREAKKAVGDGQSAVILLPLQNDILRFANSALAAEGKSEWPQKLNRYGKLDFADMNSYLSQHGIKLKYVGNGVGDFESSVGKIVIMTYHSAKGLDFQNVFIPFMNSQLFIVPDEKRSKTLFMVAMTRCRNNLYITYSGQKHGYLNAFAAQCHRLDVHRELTSPSGSISTTEDNEWGL